MKGQIANANNKLNKMAEGGVLEEDIEDVHDDDADTPRQRRKTTIVFPNMKIGGTGMFKLYY